MTTYILSLQTALLLHIARQLNAIRRQRDMRRDPLDGELNDLIEVITRQLDVPPSDQDAT